MDVIFPLLLLYNFSSDFFYFLRSLVRFIAKGQTFQLLKLWSVGVSSVLLLRVCLVAFLSSYHRQV